MLKIVLFLQLFSFFWKNVHFFGFLCQTVTEKTLFQKSENRGSRAAATFRSVFWPKKLLLEFDSSPWNQKYMFFLKMSNVFERSLQEQISEYYHHFFFIFEDNLLIFGNSPRKRRFSKHTFLLIFDIITQQHCPNEVEIHWFSCKKRDCVLTKVVKRFSKVCSKIFKTVSGPFSKMLRTSTTSVKAYFMHAKMWNKISQFPFFHHYNKSTHCFHESLFFRSSWRVCSQIQPDTVSQPSRYSMFSTEFAPKFSEW